MIRKGVDRERRILPHADIADVGLINLRLDLLAREIRDAHDDGRVVRPLHGHRPHRLRFADDDARDRRGDDGLVRVGDRLFERRLRRIVVICRIFKILLGFCPDAREIVHTVVLCTRIRHTVLRLVPLRLVVLAVERRDGLSRRHRIVLLHEHRADARGDLGADLNGIDGLYRPRRLDGRLDIHTLYGNGLNGLRGFFRLTGRIVLITAKSDDRREQHTDADDFLPFHLPLTSFFAIVICTAALVARFAALTLSRSSCVTSGSPSAATRSASVSGSPIRFSTCARYRA